MNKFNQIIIYDKKIVKKVTVPLSADKAWDKWTTHDGLLSFFGEDNKVELYPGGSYEIYMLMDNPYGLRGSEGCSILSLLPGRMLSFSWNAPPSFPEIRNSSYKTWVVIEFTETDSQNTEITLTHMGWPDDISWQPVFEYFNKAWGAVLDWLVKSIL